MATTIRELLVKLGVDSKDADKGVASLNQGLLGLTKVMAGAVAGAVAVGGAIFALGNSAAGAADEIDKGAQAAALSTTAYQELDFVASQTGTTIGQMTKAISKQSRGLDELRDGSGRAGEMLAELGLGYEYLQQLSPEEQFKATATAIQGLGSDQERLIAATQIYGDRIAMDLMPALSLGGDGIQALSDRAHDLGMILENDGIKQGVKFKDTLDELDRVVGGLKNTIGLELVPVITDLMEGFRDWYLANQKLIKGKLKEWILDIRKGIVWLQSAFGSLNDVVMATFGGWEPIILMISGAVTALMALFVAFGAMQVWGYLSTVLGAIGAIGVGAFSEIIAIVVGTVSLILLLGLVFQDLIVYFRGGESAIGKFLDRFREADGPMGSLARLMENLITLAISLGGVIAPLADLWFAVFQAVGIPVLQAFGAVVLWLAEVVFAALGWWWDNVVNPSLEAFIVLLDWLGDKLKNITGLLDAMKLAAGGAVDAAKAALSLGGGAVSSLGQGIMGAGDTAISSVSGLFAPSPNSSQLQPAGGPATTNRSVTFGGNSTVINGVGITAEQAEELLRNREREQARQYQEMISGGEI